jgi:hypothetical protein
VAAVGAGDRHMSGPSVGPVGHVRHNGRVTNEAALVPHTEDSMGFLDKLKDQASELKDKAVDTASKNSDKITSGLDKAAEFADKKTQGKYSDKIATGKAKAKQGLDKLEQKHAETDVPPPPPSVADEPDETPPAPERGL